MLVLWKGYGGKAKPLLPQAALRTGYLPSFSSACLSSRSSAVPELFTFPVPIAHIRFTAPLFAFPLLLTQPFLPPGGQHTTPAPAPVTCSADSCVLGVLLSRRPAAFCTAGPGWERSGGTGLELAACCVGETCAQEVPGTSRPLETLPRDQMGKEMLGEWRIAPHDLVRDKGSGLWTQR